MSSEALSAAEAAKILKAKRSGNGWMAHCVSHDDRTESLHISERRGYTLVRCMAGCSQEQVLRGLRDRGIKLAGADKVRWNQVAVYPYTDESGKPLFEVVRLERYVDGRCEKITPPRLPGATRFGIGETRRVLYHLPEVIEAPIVFLVEGEKDVESLRSRGFVATTSPFGANAPWLDSYTDALRGREVFLIPDADVPGRKRALRVAKALVGNVAKLILFEPPGAKDITAWFEQGHSEVELISLLEFEGVKA